MAKEADRATGGFLVTEFALGAATFGIDARLVEEVVKVGDLTPVRGAPSGIVGIRNLRGRIVTVVDMATQLGLGAAEIESESRLLIMEHLGESYGFLVDAVTDTVALDENSLEEPPSSLDSRFRSYLRGVWRDGSHLTAVLVPELLFQALEQSTPERIM